MGDSPGFCDAASKLRTTSEEVRAQTNEPMGDSPGFRRLVTSRRGVCPGFLAAREHNERKG